MIFKTNSSRTIGKQAEDIAADYLVNRGIKLIERNFYCRSGEIDLIAYDDKHVIFIEVRYRKNEKYMAVVETIDKQKCKKLVKTSEYYLNQNKNYRSYLCRYDVITITGMFNKPSIKWIKNAFQA